MNDDRICRIAKRIVAAMNGNPFKATINRRSGAFQISMQVDQSTMAFSETASQYCERIRESNRIVMQKANDIIGYATKDGFQITLKNDESKVSHAANGSTQLTVFMTYPCGIQDPSYMPDENLSFGWLKAAGIHLVARADEV